MRQLRLPQSPPRREVRRKALPYPEGDGRIAVPQQTTHTQRTRLSYGLLGGYIEPVLGLSSGYLPRLRKASWPSTVTLLAMLALFRQHPATLGQVEAFWRGSVGR